MSYDTHGKQSGRNYHEDCMSLHTALREKGADLYQ